VLSETHIALDDKAAGYICVELEEISLQEEKTLLLDSIGIVELGKWTWRLHGFVCPYDWH